ncbi:MAG: hypothetical protein ACK5M1_12595 [Xanthomarina gelatinilytica]|uniref:hypothetical protein n=1 Tax=Xanthomarina gelatinilytica TaxID=1137281 RepID=UPI003A868DD0
MSKDKFYIITIDNDNYPRTFDKKKFHNQLTTAVGVKAWWHYLESTYIIKVDYLINSNHIAGFMVEIAPDKKYFTSEIKLNDINGWLPQEAWDWIKENSNLNNSFE